MFLRIVGYWGLCREQAQVVQRVVSALRIISKSTPFGGWYIGGQCPRLKDFPKNEQLAEKRSFEGNCEILGTMFQLRALSSDIPASRKGVYLFYNPPNNCSRQTHLDRSCIFVDVFVFLCAELPTSFLISPSLASAKSILLFPMTD